MPPGSPDLTVGNAAGLGGFTFIARFGIGDAGAVAQAQMFAGVTSATSAPTGTIEPSTFTNSIGMGHGNPAANCKIFYGGSAAQTPIDLGASFPCNTRSTDMYELILFSPNNVNNVVNYRVTNLSTSAQTSGQLTGTAGTVLPSSTTLLGPMLMRDNGGTAAATTLHINKVYIETDY